jgi:hypothetical protein
MKANIIAALLLLAFCLPAFAGDAAWRDGRYAGFETKTPAELRLLRNEIFARHGRIFKTPDLREFFSKQSWYKPDPKYSEAALSKEERDLAQKLLALEKHPAEKEPRTAAEAIARGKAALAVPPRDSDDDGPGNAAIEFFNKALKLEPDNVAALKARAEADAHVLGETSDSAIADLDRAIVLAPKDAEAYRERGRWRLPRDDSDSQAKALADCRKAATLDAKDAAAYACVAQASEWTGNRAQIEEAYAKAVALTPRDARLRKNRAENLLRMGRLNEALGECDASLAIDPEDCLLYRAEILRGLHRDEEAARDQDKGGRRAMELIQNTGTEADRKLIRDVLDKK